MITAGNKLVGILLLFVAMTLMFPEVCFAQFDQRFRTRTTEGPELTEKYPKLVDLEGSYRDYGFKHFPVLEYETPDVEAWISSLVPLAEEDQDKRRVRIWYENDEPKYIFVTSQKGFGQFFIVGKDTIEFVMVRKFRIDIEATPNGIFRWQYIYADGLPRTIKFFGCPEGEPDISGFDIIRIYHKNVYWETSNKQKHVYIYRGDFKTISPDDKWASREDFDEEGNWIKSTSPEEVGLE
jgi:hypothetical protein